MKRLAIAACLIGLGLVPVPGTAVLAIVLWRRLRERNRVSVYRRPEFKLHKGGRSERQGR